MRQAGSFLAEPMRERVFRADHPPVQGVDNPDHDKMGKGIQVRSGIRSGDNKGISKGLRMAPQEVAIEENPRLLEAISGSLDQN